MSWYRVHKGSIQFRGRVTRMPLAAWLQTDEGAEALDAAARQLRFPLFARSRASRRLWRDVHKALGAPHAAAALQQEGAHFAATIAGLCYAPGLPRMQVALHRLVVVPKTMVVSRARAGVRMRLWHRTLAAIPDAVRAFLCEQILLEMDEAVREARPSPRSPVQAREGWMCVSCNSEYTWVDPIWSGRGWAGHLVMYEMPRQALTRAQRGELDRAVSTIQENLSSLSRIQRQNIVRAAADGLPA